MHSWCWFSKRVTINMTGSKEICKFYKGVIFSHADKKNDIPQLKIKFLICKSMCILLFGYSVNTLCLGLKICFHLCFSVHEGKRWVIKWPIMSHLGPSSSLPVALLPPPPICFSSLSHPLLIRTIPLSPLSHLSVISLSSGLSSLVHNFAALVRQSHSFHQGPRLDIFRQGLNFGSCSAKKNPCPNIMWHTGKGMMYNSLRFPSLFFYLGLFAAEWQRWYNTGATFIAPSLSSGSVSNKRAN